MSVQEKNRMHEVTFTIECPFCEGKLELFSLENQPQFTQFKCNNCRYEQLVTLLVETPLVITCNECGSEGEITKGLDKWIQIKCKNESCQKSNKIAQSF